MSVVDLFHEVAVKAVYHNQDQGKLHFDDDHEQMLCMGQILVAAKTSVRLLVTRVLCHDVLIIGAASSMVCYLACTDGSRSCWL